MILISLLIALAAERHLSSSFWQFKTYYNYYANCITSNDKLASVKQNVFGVFVIILLPVLLVYGLLSFIENSLLQLIISTAILIVCFGSVATRATYKKYLIAAYSGEQTTCQLHYTQLLQDKNLPDVGFGQTLIWLNYRYYIAIMFFFVCFGIPGVVFYRLLTVVVEKYSAGKESTVVENTDTETLEKASFEQENVAEAKADEQINEQLNDGVSSTNAEQVTATINAKAHDLCQQLLFWLDWLPVRITALGYMLVGHFSRALPVWIDCVFDVKKVPNNILADVAQKSEDFMIDEEDCTAEPCLLVRLAKRNLLLLLAVIAILTLAGLIS